MTLRAFLEALKNNVSVVLKESDNTQIAEFNRDSYRAIAETYLTREIDNIEIASKSNVSVVITLEEQTNTDPVDPNDP
jgi:hypothetical protein